MSNTPRSGLMRDVPAPLYFADPAWGSGALRAMRRGPPARVLWEREQRESSEAQLFGTAVHCAFLEPLRFRDAYVCKPDGMSFATKEGKAWRREHDAQVVLTFADYARVMAVVDALHAKAGVSAALSQATGLEMCAFWEDDDTGERCKGRIDLLTPTHLYDLKVSRHAEPSLAYRAFCDGWMHQLAYYRTGLHMAEPRARLRRARLIVVSPTAPHFVWTCEVKPDALDLLAIENTQTLYAMRECQRAGVWPGTPDEWTPIEPPATALIGSPVLESIASLAANEED